jgi:hypothetical protein
MLTYADVRGRVQLAALFSECKNSNPDTFEELCNHENVSNHSIYLLYWYKSINTDAADTFEELFNHENVSD